MDVKTLKITELIEYKNNARKHSKAQINQIAASIKEFGYCNPILIDENNVILAGHGRFMALKQLNYKKIPCILISTLTEAQKKAYILADNKIAENAQWDEDLLRIELGDLKEIDPDQISLIGFSAADINKILTPKGSEGDDGENKVPPPEEKIFTKLGDIWQLGNHRLICGDSTDHDTVKRLMESNNAILMVTDPPYGVNYDPKWREGCDLGVGKRSTGKVLNDDRADWTEAWELFRGNVTYVWHADKFAVDVFNSLKRAGFEIRNQIIWVKQHFVLSRGNYHFQHEPCWYAVRKGAKGNWTGDRKQTTTWEIKNNNAFGNAKPEETVGHGTQKPVECMRRPILNNSIPQDGIYDPFSGSGTTIIACEQTDRKCYAIELSPQYVDITVKRWQDYTGEEAMNLTSGKKLKEYV